MTQSSGNEHWRYGAIKHPKLVIIGAGEFAEIAHDYFNSDSPYEVVGFCAEREFLVQDKVCGLPVVAFEEIEKRFPPESHSAFVAVTYTKLNRIRARLFNAAKSKRYSLATYVSSNAFVWYNAQIGENVFIFENNVIQHKAVISDNCILWSGNHIGHRSRISPHCYLASHIVVSGFCNIGEYCFLGVNVTVADRVNIGRDCLIGAGSIVLRDIPDDSLLQSDSTPVSKVSALRFSKLPRGQSFP